MPETTTSAEAPTEADAFFTRNQPGPRYCVTCRHFRPTSWLFADKCQRPRGALADPVTGAARKRDSIPARFEREGYFSTVGAPPVRLFGACGPLGHHWQPREGEAE